MRRALVPYFRYVLPCALLGTACTSPGGDSDVERGGAVAVTRARLGANETLTAVAAFFAPPGPPEESWPARDACVVSAPAPSPSPTGTPVQWRDAGSHVSLHGGSSALTLTRFETGGAIVYLAAPDADPADVPLGVTYDLTIAGSTAPNGIASKTIEDALEMPPAVGLSAPDFSSGAVALSGTSLHVGWSGGVGGREALVTLLVSGTAGSVTLRCATADDGSFALDAAHLAGLPSGPGLLGVTRADTTVSPLDGTIDLVATGNVVESGPVLLP